MKMNIKLVKLLYKLFLIKKSKAHEMLQEMDMFYTMAAECTWSGCL